MASRASVETCPHLVYCVLFGADLLSLLHWHSVEVLEGLSVPQTAWDSEVQNVPQLVVIILQGRKPKPLKREGCGSPGLTDLNQIAALE